MGIAVGVNDLATIKNNALASGAASSKSGNSAADLNDQFLTLLVTQLKNQDPTNPMDNSQMTSQLAQINTLSGIEKLNTTLGAISGQINTSQSLQASTLIDHGVMVEGSKILAGSGTTTPFGIELAQASTSTIATITNASGDVMRTIDLGALSSGVHIFSWDGTDTSGASVADGKYNVSFTASNSTGQLTAQPLNYAYISGVTTDSHGAILDLGTYGTTTLDKVRQIL
ncbi:flagellar basal body rod modification protein [Erwinia sp. OLTSP20]|uniref:flagellar hook assembly protein FlgD n=1 Tax=unclassified Erwinia TaxID=2622719 RepID=UPI000C18BB9E|nr:MULTISPECIES: flagellar hook assembly protein FlgD [unclassified Erwinia]PIJ51921.1 flagellar basal body rod modification protein [Erwinia sp. OAMSP11]PIJ74796.1 flagellar basal body rod modification protein [Erwinia sp. OLSSP12]PIJ85182.1 flagellar basal body rod modification protein [Erwinia sp. OLCASP19]PIJ87183.1 flagellar basal body rod modification protein [Erwinia sp. OLMTSP26]PIJ88327.1 flagellar basal body rod modification protein [Erwinia sp. OLMDSP33]